MYDFYRQWDLMFLSLFTYLNNTTNPYASTHIPMIGHPNNTIIIPPKNAADPLALCHWKKNRKVLSKPITNANPLKNKIYKINNYAIFGSLLEYTIYRIPVCCINLILSILTFPIANSPLSNNNRTPRNRKATPNPANPTPISKNIMSEIRI